MGRGEVRCTLTLPMSIATRSIILPYGYGGERKVQKAMFIIGFFAPADTNIASKEEKVDQTSGTPRTTSQALAGLHSEGFPRCHRHDPEMEKCLLAATETVRPFVLTGVPDFIPGIQNFSIPRISVKDGNEALNYKAELHNLTMYGLEDYKFNRYYYNPENGTFLINVQLPHLFLKGRYNLNGRIFFAPLKGNGDFHVNITDSSCAVFHTVDIVKKNGTDFMQPTKTLPKMKVGKIIDYEFDGLFKDNKDLELLARQVIHENLMVIVDELLPTVEQVLGALFDELIFKSVTRIPYDKLYPK